MDGPSEKAPTRKSTIQRIDRKTSSLSMLAGTMAFTFLAGIRTDSAVQGLFHHRAEYRWPMDFAFSMACAIVALRWGLSLLKRAKLNEGARA